MIMIIKLIATFLTIIAMTITAIPYILCARTDLEPKLENYLRQLSAFINLLWGGNEIKK